MVQASSAKLDPDNVLGVASETDGAAALSAWVSEELDKAIVVASCDETLVWARVDTIDVTTVGSSWEKPVDCPAKFAVLRRPHSTCSIRSSTWILSAVRNSEEEQLVAIADRSYQSAILTPIQTSNGSIMFTTFTDKSIV